MATPADVVNIALAENGYHDGQGYDEINKYAQFFGINFGIAYCDIFIAWCYEQAGLPLPKMGSWIRSGSQYCPDSWNYALSHGATAPSYLAQPGWQCMFNWDGDAAPMGGNTHTEMVIKWENGILHTVGGNSGPAGGVNVHQWSCPVGVGNGLIQGVIDTSKLVSFSNGDEFVMDAEAKAAFADLKAAVITVVEGGLDPKKNPYAIEGFRDVVSKQEATDAKIAKIAQHLGVAL